MTTRIIYVADDGARFDTPQQCADYERLCENVRRANDIIYAVPNDSDFFSGRSGYVQQDPSLVYQWKLELLRLIANAGIEEAREPNVNIGWIERILGESGPFFKPLHRAWLRILHMDDLHREWGQPYYANHPEAAKNQTPINA